ncbi:MAG: TetR/AcrR family transcriptional regulator [Oscillospiraceae bacterium]
MGEKAEQKRQFIINTAKLIFAKKGFKSVTMNDIITACNISRGGIYLYFKSTEEIFEEILKSERQQDNMLCLINDKSSAKDILLAFLDMQKKEILSKSDNLIIATYEYFFAQSNNITKLGLEIDFNNAVNKISSIIKYGIEKGEFVSSPSISAENIVFLLEGLRLSSLVITISQQQVDNQINYIVSQLERAKNEE